LTVAILLQTAVSGKGHGPLPTVLVRRAMETNVVRWDREIVIGTLTVVTV